MPKKAVIFIALTACAAFACAQESPHMIVFDVPEMLKPADAEASSTRPTEKDKEEDFYAKNVIDKRSNTLWSSTFEEPQWLMLDLGGVSDVDKVVISWGPAYAVSYKIEVSAQEGSWKEVYATDSGRGRTETVTFPLARARYIKLDLLKKSGEGGFSLWEISVYGKRKLVLF